jgi:phosphoglycolate phosphatase
MTRVATARVVFDLDGTLIDSAPDIRALANALLTREGAAPLTLAETRDFIGHGVAAFVARMRAARHIPEAEHDRLMSDFVRGYEDAFHLTTPYPRVPETLQALRAAGHRLGICTNKPLRPCRAVLAHLGLLDHFEVTVGGDSMAQRKPDPAPLDAAFRELGTGPRLYVGDSETDAETARRADVPFLLFSGGYRKQPVTELPHALAFDDFGDLPRCILDLLGRDPPLPEP